MASFINSHCIADTEHWFLGRVRGVHGDGSSSHRFNVSQRAVVAGRLSAFAETVSPEPSLSQDIGQENLISPSGSSSNTFAATHVYPPRKAAVRKNFKEAGGASNVSSRAKATKGEEDGDDASEDDALSPRFASAFAAAARVTNLEPCRKGARKAPRTGRDGELCQAALRVGSHRRFELK